MMTSRRLVAANLGLQLLGLLLLTQTWYSISMKLNGNPTVLGDFQGSSAYSLAMPVTLFQLASTLVALLTTARVSRFVLATQSLVSLALAVWIGMQVVSVNISELDPQLDRLTGIAKTHGVAGLQVVLGINPWLWILLQLLVIFVCGYLAASSKGWASTSSEARGDSVRTSSVIDLWDSQRG